MATSEFQGRPLRARPRHLSRWSPRQGKKVFLEGHRYPHLFRTPPMIRSPDRHEDVKVGRWCDRLHRLPILKLWEDWRTGGGFEVMPHALSRHRRRSLYCESTSWVAPLMVALWTLEASFSLPCRIKDSLYPGGATARLQMKFSIEGRRNPK